MGERPGAWTWTCHERRPGAKDGARPGCGHHEHHRSPRAADLASRRHQAGHAVEAGAQQADVPDPAADAAWGPFCALWNVPVVGMGGPPRPGCPDCAALRPKADPGFY